MLKVQSPQFVALCNDRQKEALKAANGKAATWGCQRWLIEIDHREVALVLADESIPPAPKECEAILGQLSFVPLP